MTTYLVGICIVIGMAVTIHAEDGKDLAGTYRLIDGMRNGERIATERLKDVTVRIEKNAITTYDKDKREVYAASYQIERKEKPWKIHMEAKLVPNDPRSGKPDGVGTKAEGLIEVDGETVKLIYALPGGSAPTDFKCEANQQMFVLKRLKTES